ncbi:MAG: ATP-binding cassette domain-containing protein [Alphaproteobacteria bacterium]
MGSAVCRAGVGALGGLSLASGLVTTGVSVAIVIALVAGWWGTRSFARLTRLIAPLLSIPHAAAAFGLAFLIAPSGWLMRLFSPWATGMSRPPDLLIVHDTYGLAMMAGLVGKEVPFLLLMVLAALPQTQNAKLMQVTGSLGYGRVAGWIKAVFPQIYRQIRLPVLAVVAYASSVVDVALILGPTTPAPLAVRLVGWMADPDIAMRFMASAGPVMALQHPPENAGLDLAQIRIDLAGTKLVSVNLHIAPGQVATVMGPSGSGKSTLLAFVGGFLDPAFTATGHVVLNGADITHRRAHARRLGILFQDDLLFPHLSVARNLMFAIPANIRGRQRRHIAEAALAQVGLEGLGPRDPATLSGGQRARVALMRVLLAEPWALLLDEPFSRLDADRRTQIRELVFSLARGRQLPVLLVTHDPLDAKAAGGVVARVGEEP